jgi:hypothetical protein
MRTNKAEIPPNFLQTKTVPHTSSKFIYDKQKTLVCFIPKKNKTVLILSSMHTTGEVYEASRKPEQILYYNKTKIGVNVSDQMAHAYTTSRKTQCWPLRCFYGMLDAAAINACPLQE